VELHHVPLHLRAILEKLTLIDKKKGVAGKLINGWWV